MAIYVDALVNWGAQWGKSCHMDSDKSIEELTQFARQCGIPVAWLHNRPGLPHYDLNRRYRAVAVANGAIEVTSNELWRRCADRKEDQE